MREPYRAGLRDAARRLRKRAGSLGIAEVAADELRAMADTLTALAKTPVPERQMRRILVAQVLERVVPGPGGCLLWQGATAGGGYGRIRFAGKAYAAHRVVLEHALGRALEPDEEACHHCDVPGCVNRDHLFAGTRSENVRDMHAKGRAGAQSRPRDNFSHNPCAKNGDNPRPLYESS